MAKVLLVANWDWVLYNFRLPLARALEQAGYEVILVCPEGKYLEQIKAQGFRHLPWSLSRRSLNPFQEVSAIFALRKLYQEQQPDLVNHFTIKPNIYGSLAALFLPSSHSKRPWVINAFTGLGFLFSPHPISRGLRLILDPLLRQIACHPRIWTVFQNQDNWQQLLQQRLVSGDRSNLIISSGVNLHRYQPLSTAAESGDPPIVLMAARLLWDKGVDEFVKASAILKQRGLTVRFWLAGEPDRGNPSCVPDSHLQQWQQEHLIECLGHQSDMPGLLQKVQIAVLPSYHEGVPRFLLEAAATGLPLVATQIEGCRLVVEAEKNGILVPVGDAVALADAIERLVVNPTLRHQMGAASRAIAAEKFDEEKILNQWLQLYQQILPITKPAP